MSCRLIKQLDTSSSRLCAGAATLESTVEGLQAMLERAAAALREKSMPQAQAAELRAQVAAAQASLTDLHASLGAQLGEGTAGRCRSPTSHPVLLLCCSAPQSFEGTRTFRSTHVIHMPTCAAPVHVMREVVFGSDLHARSKHTLLLSPDLLHF